MNSQEKVSPGLDLVAGLVTAFLLLAIALTVWIGSQAGIRVTLDPGTRRGVGPLETLTLRFSEPVDAALAIERFSIQPPVDGSFRWEAPKSLQFVPRAPFQPGTDYTLSLAAGSLTQDGKSLLKRSRAWDFRVRTPLVAYLVVEGTSSRIWTVDPASGRKTPLTSDSFQVIAFDAADSGEFLIFSALNQQQGMDLWLVTRDGGDPVLLLDCGLDRCSVPAISSFDRRVAYVREAAGLGASLQFGAPRIWVLDLETGQNAPLYEDQQIIGSRPVWSPDGTRLSSYDGLADEIRLLDIVTGNQLIIPSQTGSPVSWSADGDTFVFTDIAVSDSGLFTRIRQAKLTTQEIVTMFGESDEIDYHYNSLAWSPAEDKIVLGLRTDPNSPSESLWLMDPATLGGQMIAEQPDYIYSNPQWDPWGQALVFQQFNIQEAYSSEIGLWMPGLDRPQVLTDGILPLWLP